MDEINLTKKQIDKILFEKGILVSQFREQYKKCNERAEAWSASRRRAYLTEQDLLRDIERLKSSKLWTHAISKNQWVERIKTQTDVIIGLDSKFQGKILTEKDVYAFKEQIKYLRSNCFQAMKQIDKTIKNIKDYDNVSTRK